MLLITFLNCKLDQFNNYFKKFLTLNYYLLAEDVFYSLLKFLFYFILKGLLMTLVQSGQRTYLQHAGNNLKLS